jgi:hypothetical protein
MKYVFPDASFAVKHGTPYVLEYQQEKLQLVKFKQHAPLLTTSLIAQAEFVYVFAPAAVPQAQQFNAGVHMTHAMSLLRVSKNTVFAKAVSSIQQDK